MKLFCLVVTGFIGFLIEKCYAPCKDVKVPANKPTYSASEQRAFRVLGNYMYNTWVRKIGGTKRGKRDVSHIAEDVVHERVKRNFYPYPPNRAIRRKEYRQMTVSEMKAFHRCINALKKGRNSQYDRFARQHAFDMAPAAHLGAAFLPWHREFLYRVESAMRQRNPSQCWNVYLPYWDCSLDEKLPSPHHSVVWQKKFWGTSMGTVTQGSFGKNWNVIDECSTIGDKLRRQVNTTGMPFCSRENILSLFAAKSYRELMTFAEDQQLSQFELDHGGIHCYVGDCITTNPGCRGHLGCVDCSPNDPLFYLLHSFVDCLWYEWAALPGRDNTYPSSITANLGGANHSANAQMRPFKGMTNKQGMYNDRYSRCLPRPGRAGFVCRSDRDCNSPQGLLWCTMGTSASRTSSGESDCSCRSKIREGGNCKNLPDKSCYCYRGKPSCSSGKCKCKRR